MLTIEIVSEVRNEKKIYRAICGERQAIGATAGQALDALERQLAAQGQSSDMLVIVQRFLADDLFTTQQQSRLGELMARFHSAVDVGEILISGDRDELESLVEAEWEAAIERAARIPKANGPDEK